MRGLVLTLLCVALPFAAKAERVFFLQLGTTETMEEAQAMAESALQTHAETLGNLPFAPKATRRGGEVERVRVQLGPLVSRSEANKACASLRDKGENCFVVETTAKRQAQPVQATQAPADQSLAAQPLADQSAAVETGGFFSNLFGSDTQQPAKEEAKPITADDVPLPVIEKQTNLNVVSVRAENDVTPNTPEIDLFGRLFGGESKASEAEIKPSSTAVMDMQEPAAMQPAQPLPSMPDPITIGEAKQGKVEVAEAIPVPLSDASAREEVLPEMKVVEAKPTLFAPTKREPRKNMFVAPFTSGPVAMSCFDTMATAEPALRRLKARAQMSVAGAALPTAVLRVSQVPESLQERLCALSAACGEALKCGTGKMPVDEEQKPEVESKEVSVMQTETFTAGGYWAQLGAFPSYAHAQSRFEELQEAQPDLLGGVNAVIRSPASKRSKTYRLRIGPYETQSQADSTCWKLAARGVDCLTISE